MVIKLQTDKIDAYKKLSTYVYKEYTSKYTSNKN